MTNTEKNQIETMRNGGRTITDIALKLGIPESTAKSYCYRKKQKQLEPKEPARSGIYAKSYLDCPSKQSGNGQLQNTNNSRLRISVNFLFHPPKTAFHLQWKVEGVVS